MDVKQPTKGSHVQLHKPAIDSWCVMHSEPSYLCDYDFFPSLREAKNYAEHIMGNALADGVSIQVFIMRVVLTSYPDHQP